jgi:hypothetical protein
MKDLVIPEKVKNIIKKFAENKAEIYIVGGAVRDLILGREVNDWDFTTNLTPEEKGGGSISVCITQYLSKIIRRYRNETI